jgi:hypothetical protein
VEDTVPAVARKRQSKIMGSGHTRHFPDWQLPKLYLGHEGAVWPDGHPKRYLVKRQE